MHVTCVDHASISPTTMHACIYPIHIFISYINKNKQATSKWCRHIRPAGQRGPPPSLSFRCPASASRWSSSGDDVLPWHWSTSSARVVQLIRQARVCVCQRWIYEQAIASRRRLMVRRHLVGLLGEIKIELGSYLFVLEYFVSLHAWTAFCRNKCLFLRHLRATPRAAAYQRE